MRTFTCSAGDPDQDPAVFGYGIDPKVPFAPADFPALITSPVSPFTLALVIHGVANERTIYATKASVVDSPNVAWEPVAAQSDDVTGFDVKGSTIYLLTHKDAPTFKLVATSLDAPNIAGAKTVIAPGVPILEDLGVASDGLYVLGRNGGFGQITKVALGADGTPGAGTPLALPFDGAVNAIATDPREPGVTFGMTGWTHSLLYYYADAGGAVADTHIKPIANVDMTPYTSLEVQARSQDGTMVPLSVVFKKDLKLDGSHPTYLNGYGSYGIELNPSFSATRVASLNAAASLPSATFAAEVGTARLGTAPG